MLHAFFHSNSENKMSNWRKIASLLHLSDKCLFNRTSCDLRVANCPSLWRETGGRDGIFPLMHFPIRLVISQLNESERVEILINALHIKQKNHNVLKPLTILLEAKFVCAIVMASSVFIGNSFAQQPMFSYCGNTMLFDGMFYGSCYALAAKWYAIWPFAHWEMMRAPTNVYFYFFGSNFPHIESTKCVS